MNKREFPIRTTADYNIFSEYIDKELYPYIVKNLNFEAFDVTIEKHITKRTNLQNAFYWANASDIATFLNDKGCSIQKMGIACQWSKDDVDDVNKTQFGTSSTAKLSTKEFGDLMENTFAFWIDKTKGEWKPLETAESYFANNK